MSQTNADGPIFVGQMVRIWGVCTDLITKQLVDPTTVTAEIRLPDGTTDTSATVTRLSLGVYYCDYTTVQSGEHIGKLVGAGAVVTVGEIVFIAFTNFS